MEDYRKWKAMGEGGTSHSIIGYLSQLSVDKTRAYGPNETIKPGFYNKPEKRATGWKKATEEQRANAKKSFLKEPLPVRPGPRARALPFVYPQRERNAADPQPPDVKQASWSNVGNLYLLTYHKAYLDSFKKLGEINAEWTEWNISAMEKHGQALFTKPSIPLSPLAGPSAREICHIHGTDLSGHVTLSFPDAEEVISKGWGERHRLSGTGWIHLGFTMLYVPNTIEETEIFMKIFQAGIDYMKSG
ncbi:uncharacterized protein F4807DRAFT_463085 [Annulohypoxylon truncatum]|uniref:uncharacterized protein n=1 Tax=Annulohypoxylon truncatum TaxID=327061 RepID=UPI002008C21A|nr:uncharacterized protein F4807DRAFT_463085 [Annulohypoxylon truncatum]KAI1207021.1 hypothetical protein F4807DRAFT_463085 [Annulohypoxylon truncatum]